MTTLIVHWDGTGWTWVPSPGPSGSHLIAQLNYLSMDSVGDGWAVGDVQDAQHGTTQNPVAHWNGTSWQQVTVSPAFSFRGVAGFSPANAWAVGYERTSSGGGVPLERGRLGAGGAPPSAERGFPFPGRRGGPERELR